MSAFIWLSEWFSSMNTRTLVTAPDLGGARAGFDRGVWVVTGVVRALGATATGGDASVGDAVVGDAVVGDAAVVEQPAPASARTQPSARPRTVLRTLGWLVTTLSVDTDDPP